MSENVSVGAADAAGPLVSYLILACNQEAFIGDAIRSAFSQTYSPLEIVISDDCSRDGTVAIINDCVSRYDGPHAVRVNRNASNLGIGGNVNRGTSLCRGDLVVVAAGDDVSLPTRTSVLCAAWEASGRRATSIFSSYIVMSETGDEICKGGLRALAEGASETPVLRGDLMDFVRLRTPVVNGCTHAWSPRLFEYFGPLLSDLEDLVLSFRTLAIGEMVYVDQPLVRYRRHDSNVSFLAEEDDTRSFEHREERLRSVDRKTVAALDNISSDIDVLVDHGRVTFEEATRLKTEILKARRRYALELQMLESSFLQRGRALAAAALRGEFQATLKSLPRGLPRGVYRRLYELRQRGQGRGALGLARHRGQ